MFRIRESQDRRDAADSRHGSGPSGCLTGKGAPIICPANRNLPSAGSAGECVPARRGALRLFIALWVGAAFGITGLSKADDEAVFVVAHPGVSTQTLTRDTTRALFGMRQRSWPDGEIARVFVLGDNDPVHVRFAKEELGVFPHQLRLAWDRAVFSGTGQAPRRVGSLSEMHERVGTTPGAIGYLTKEYLDERIQVIEME
ncbi:MULTISPECIES: hypothetical protein [unclassified Thioalkalivibrio]|uniref:hypothetical protein n=1 Tax=unclassified Thioalkalivibrio TaxID=2621013 RepID=UPI001E3A7C99|nr:MULTISPECIES: hypothetical protein [unclassified Thioalkalivibrio]